MRSLLLLLAACNTPTDPGSDPDTDTDTDTDTPPELVACEAPTGLQAPSLTEAAAVDAKAAGLQGPVHMTDLILHDDILFAVGSGGLLSFRDTNGSLELLDRDGSPGSELHRVVGVGTGRLATSHREKGVRFYDVTDPTNLSPAMGLQLEGASGMAFDASEELVYVLTHTGSLHVVSLSGGPAEVGVLEGGLGNPWEIVLDGSLAYVADNGSNLHVVDLTDPLAPVLAETIPLAGGAQDLTLHEGRLHVAIGSAGIETFSLTNPSLPVSESVVALGDPVIGVSAAGDLLWATNHAGVVVLDATPLPPTPVGSLPTPQWAMHPVASDGVAWVADWEVIRRYEATAAPAPIADLSQTALYFFDGPQSVDLTLTNRGSADLSVAVASKADARFSAVVGASSVAPGAQTTLTVSFSDDGAPIDSTLCLVTNDPSAPVQEVTLSSTNTGSSIGIGEQALDFTLTDLDGVSHTLSSQLGSPVVLAYFATW